MTSFWELTPTQRENLVKDDPIKFEQLVTEEQERLFKKNEKLRQTQWIVSKRLRKIKNPVERMNQAGVIMMEKFKELNDALAPFRRK